MKYQIFNFYKLLICTIIIFNYLGCSSSKNQQGQPILVSQNKNNKKKNQSQDLEIYDHLSVFKKIWILEETLKKCFDATHLHLYPEANTADESELNNPLIQEYANHLINKLVNIIDEDDYPYPITVIDYSNQKNLSLSINEIVTSRNEEQFIETTTQFLSHLSEQHQNLPKVFAYISILNESKMNQPATSANQDNTFDPNRIPSENFVPPLLQTIPTLDHSENEIAGSNLPPPVVLKTLRPLPILKQNFTAVKLPPCLDNTAQENQILNDPLLNSSSNNIPRPSVAVPSNTMLMNALGNLKKTLPLTKQKEENKPKDERFLEGLMARIPVMDKKTESDSEEESDSDNAGWGIEVDQEDTNTDVDAKPNPKISTLNPENNSKPNASDDFRIIYPSKNKNFLSGDTVKGKQDKRRKAINGSFMEGFSPNKSVEGDDSDNEF